MSALVLNGSTSGQITLQPAAVAGTNTLTIPAVTGTVLTNPVSGTFVASTISSAAATPLLLQTNNGTTALYIDTSQNVGIGKTSITNKLDVQSTGTILGLYGVGATYQGFAVYNNYASSSNYGGIFYDARNENGIPVATFLADINTDGSSAWSWLTQPAGTRTDRRVERMRIDSSGNLLVGYTSSNGSYKLQVNSQIFATSSTIATSDANYKTNVTPLTGALDLVSKLNPVSFNWKQHPVHDFDTQNTTVGFLAQEVQTALSGQAYVNSIIKESEVTLLDETKEKFLGIAEGNMIAILTKAIQELKATVDAQAAEITALKTKVNV